MRIAQAALTQETEREYSRTTSLESTIRMAKPSESMTFAQLFGQARMKGAPRTSPGIPNGISNEIISRIRPGGSTPAWLENLMPVGANDGLNAPVPQPTRNLLASLKAMLAERLFLLDALFAQRGEGGSDKAEVAPPDPSAAAEGLLDALEEPREASKTVPNLPPVAVPRMGGMILEARAETYEYERTSYRASGSVRTSDGKAFDFDVELEMERESRQIVELSLALDPLVINFEGTAAELEKEYLAFDLNADGTLESIPQLSDKSAYLALDLNSDGVINDGSELFGAQSGDGFGDLSVYDEDGNGWIDEADPVFDRLCLWGRTPDGEPELLDLCDRNVGAICLDASDTEFLLAKEGRALGAIRQTGLALTEDGRPVTVQQIDLAVRPRPVAEEEGRTQQAERSEHPAGRGQSEEHRRDDASHGRG